MVQLRRSNKSLRKNRKQQQKQQQRKQQQQNSRRQRNSRRQQRRQQGGDGQLGHTRMPSQYFGNSAVNRYFPEGDANLESPPSAYGETHAVSHGTEIEP